MEQNILYFLLIWSANVHKIFCIFFINLKCPCYKMHLPTYVGYYFLPSTLFFSQIDESRSVAVWPDGLIIFSYLAILENDNLPNWDLNFAKHKSKHKYFQKSLTKVEHFRQIWSRWSVRSLLCCCWITFLNCLFVKREESILI